MWESQDRPYSMESAGGDWSFRLPDGRLGCSSRNPREEARRRCRQVPVGSRPVLLGLGAGHDLEALLELEPTQLTVVEADSRSLATARERWRRMGLRPQEDPRVHLITAHGDAQLLPMLVDELASEHGERPVVLQPLCAELWRPTCPGAARLADDLLRHRMQAARQEAALRENEQRNQGRLSVAIPVESLRGAWGQDPVLVCGAGPGLLPALDAWGVRLDMRLVAVSTALPVLAARGICPDVVVATDPSHLLLADLVEGLDLSSTPLVVFPGSSALLLAAWPGPLVLALPRGPGLHRQSWGEVQPGLLRAGCGTVAAPALDFAALSSSGALYLAGVDLKASGEAYAAGVRRPRDLPAPDFAYSRRRMVDLVRELRRAGRSVLALGEQPDWLSAGEDKT